MKKVIGFLIMAVFAACTCLSQIPDQVVFVDENCEALLPDFTPDVVVTDNCDNAVISQSPVAGTTLTSAQPTTLVSVIATDISGNSASISFNVILLDTIAPTIVPGPGLLTYTDEEQGRLIDSFHKSVGQRYDEACDICPDSLKYAFCDSLYYTHNMVTVSGPPPSKYNLSTFVSPDVDLCHCDSTQLANSIKIYWTQ